MKIVSLAPTQTEIIAALGQMDHLTGITENCDYPESILGISTFGSWYAPDLNRVVDLRPDLVCTFGAHQEEVKNALTAAGIEVYHSDPHTVRESIGTIEELARLTSCAEAGKAVAGELIRRLDRLRIDSERIDPSTRPKVLRIMHWAPFITVGPGSFQHDVIELAGGVNIMGDGVAPYFSCKPEEVIARDPEAIFFCEPPIKDLLRENPEWQAVTAIRENRLFTFDCGLTCRSGPRIVKMVEQLAKALRFKA